MKLNKTTINFARKRGLDITTTDLENDNDNLLLCIWEADNDCEWMCSYRINPNGSYTWKSRKNCQPPSRTRSTCAKFWRSSVPTCT